MASTTGWNPSNAPEGAVSNDQSSNNSSGFNAFPEGYRNYSGSFYSEGANAIFWSSSYSTTSGAFDRLLDTNYSYLASSSYNKQNGFSVRFVRD